MSEIVRPSRAATCCSFSRVSWVTRTPSCVVLRVLFSIDTNNGVSAIRCQSRKAVFLFSAPRTIPGMGDTGRGKRGNGPQVGVRLSSEEKASWEAAADLARRSVSDWVRNIVEDWLRGSRPDIAFSEDQLLRLQLLQDLEEESAGLVAVLLALGKAALLDPHLEKALRHLRNSVDSKHGSPARGRGGRSSRKHASAASDAGT